jgi:hypothetical protein
MKARIHGILLIGWLITLKETMEKQGSLEFPILDGWLLLGLLIPILH